MIDPSFNRLVRMYQERLLKLFRGRTLLEMIENPELANEPAFRVAAERLAQAMAREIVRSNARGWRAAAMQSTGARRIYQGIQAEIAGGGFGPALRKIAERNARLIGSIPGEIAQRVTAQAGSLQAQGGRAVELSREIKRLAPALTKSKVELIARTEIGRAETDVTRVRAESIGIDWYQWTTSEDQRVRPSHRKMDKVLVAWNEAPSPEALIGERSTLGRYHAGQCPNCRCAALPLADLAEVSWPCRVYHAGAVTRMTRAQFSRMAGLRIAA